MPTASIDFLLASFAIIIAVVGALYGVGLAVEPYMAGQSVQTNRYNQIGRCMLLSSGEPDGWGAGGTLVGLGFAASGGAYKLDIDKVTRLNPSNAYALSYSQLWSALGVRDLAFRIRVDMPFNLTLRLASSRLQGDNTTYKFNVSVTRWGFPLPTDTRYYVVVRDFADSSRGVTGSDGAGTVEFSLPNSLSGTALLVGFARVEESMVSCSVLPFSHSAPAPEVPGSFANLNPLNYTLHIVLTGGGSVTNAAVLSFGYMFNLAGDGATYTIPRLLDASPMVLVLTGMNGSDHWAEWVTYPQVPLAIGADMSDAYDISDVASIPYLVEVRGALYRFEVSFRSPREDD